MAEAPANYEQSGVNVELGDDLSRTLYEAARLTWPNRAGLFGEPRELHDSFSGFRAMPAELISDHRNVFLGMSDDGVGTKVEVAERTLDHSTVAFDLLAMVCDDAVVRGAEPIAVTTTLDVNKLEDTETTRAAIHQLAEGYVAAANAAGVAVINGEVAELGDRVGGYKWPNKAGFNYNWSATVLWAAHKNRIITGYDIEPGHALVGLAEQGFRSNGLSLVRKILAERLGPEWHTFQEGGYYLGNLVQQPSIIYSKLITELTGGYDIQNPALVPISGVAHITGGGLPGKLKRMLEPSGLAAHIGEPFSSPEIMRYVQELGGVSDREAYSTWNMGQGMVIATPEPQTVIDLAMRRGFAAQQIGEAVDSPDRAVPYRSITVKNHGLFTSRSAGYLVF